MKSRVQKPAKPSRKSHRPWRRSRVWVWVGVGMLLALFATQNVIEMRQESCTSDEVVHLPAGYTYVLTRDFRLNPEHPPLLKELCALPLLFPHPRINFSDPNWTLPPAEEYFGSHFLYSNDADRLLFWGRLPIVLLGCLLGLFVFRWSQHLYGNGAGFFALTLYAFSPNIIAHSHFVTTDLGVSAFLTMALYFLWRHLFLGEKQSLFWSALAMGAALVSKFSGVVLLPWMILLLWTFHESGLLAPNPGKSLPMASEMKISGPKGQGSPPEIRVPPSGLEGLWKSLLAINRSKIFTLLIFIALIGLVVQLSYLGSLDFSLYFKGLKQVDKNHRPDYYYYLHGQLKQGGWWYYFLVAFLVKATVPFIVLIFTRLLSLFWSWRREWKTAMFLLAPAVLMFVAVSAFADPMGVRYLLPIFPLLMIFSGGLVGRFAKNTAVLVGLFALLAWHVTSSVWAFPHHLSYFNEFVGGPAHGIEWLDDSNVDWGQELKSLKKVMAQQGIPSVVLFSFSPFDNPGYYGIKCSRPDPEKPIQLNSGYYVVSAHLLARMKASTGFDWNARFPLVANLGYSMYIFQVP